jgi:hypothetical protein
MNRCYGLMTVAHGTRFLITDPETHQCGQSLVKGFSPRPSEDPALTKPSKVPIFALLLLSPNHLYDVCLVYDLDSMQCLFAP